MKKLLMFATVMLVSLSLMGCNFNKDKGVTKQRYHQHNAN